MENLKKTQQDDRKHRKQMNEADHLKLRRGPLRIGGSPDNTEAALSKARWGPQYLRNSGSRLPISGRPVPQEDAETPDERWQPYPEAALSRPRWCP